MGLRICALLLTLLPAGMLPAQQQSSAEPAQSDYVPSLTFEVAAIRESAPGQSFNVSFFNPPHSSEVLLKNNSLTNLLVMAYGVDGSQLVGVPDWTRGDLFTVEAKADGSVDEKLAKLSNEQARMEKQHMLQVLLAERFQLKAHWITKDGQIYELNVAKGGSKLQAGGSTPVTDQDVQWSKVAVPIYQRGNGHPGYEYVAHSCPMNLLTRTLSGQMGAPVIDKTGLQGTFDFVLRYHGRFPSDSEDDASMWPPLIVAVPEQLGLKLQASHGPRSYLVIDHMERPSAN